MELRIKEIGRGLLYVMGGGCLGMVAQAQISRPGDTMSFQSQVLLSICGLLLIWTSSSLAHYVWPLAKKEPTI